MAAMASVSALGFMLPANAREAAVQAQKSPSEAKKERERAKLEAEEAEQMAEMQAEYSLNQAAAAAVNIMLKDEVLLGNLRASFDKFDQDGGGSIDLSEFGKACKEIGKEFENEDELQETMARFDQSGDGDISFSEFLDWWKEDAREAWKVQQKANSDATVHLEASINKVLKV